MKSLRIAVAITLLLQPILSFGQQNSEVIDMKKHKIIIQFADSDSVAQVRVTQQIGNVLRCWPNAEIEIVCLAGGLDLLMSKKTEAGKEVADWGAKGIVFAACNNTMKMRNVKKEDLLKEATVVPSAIVELATKQEQGWSYFRGGH
jgi:intracellular sulfur oxidation DsrE/DsrF family protein